MTKEELENALQFCYTKSQLQDYFSLSNNQIRYQLSKYSLKPLLDAHSKDERGNVYGDLTVIELAGRNKRGEVTWKCICKCGKEVVRSGAELRRQRGVPKCDECSRQQRAEIRFQNHAGEQHNCLTVIRPTRKRNSTGNIYWLCKCECGNYIEISSSRLKYNSPYEAQSCGCQVSKGEYFLNIILNEKKIKYKTQYTFEDCRSSKTNALYKFDFAIFNDENKLLCLIEYNGKQHYTFSSTGWNTKEEFLKVQFRDKEKIQYCENNNIPLLIIPYTIDTKEKIEKEVFNFLTNFTN